MLPQHPSFHRDRKISYQGSAILRAHGVHNVVAVVGVVQGVGQTYRFGWCWLDAGRFDRNGFAQPIHTPRMENA
jgi:hypothetical protein